MATSESCIESLVSEWDGESVVVRHDRESGTWIFIALHDTTLGPASGGSRVKVYPRPVDGLQDALRLAAGMTAKWAALEYPYGGGKAVLAVPRPLEGAERRGLLTRYAALLESLHGSFSTGVDLGTTPEDMEFLAERTRWILHGPGGHPGCANPSPYTAHGVFLGLQAALTQVFGSDAMAGRTVLVQGVGSVGGALARALAVEGARVLVSDVDGGRAAALAAELSAEVVDPEAVYDTPCDVYAPCAVGATLNRETIPRLACRIVAGSANNQLATDGDAERLRQRGILYAPDYVINAGGALTLGSLARGVSEERELKAQLVRIRTSLEAIFREAGERNESPLAAAQRRVRRVLARAGQPAPVG